MRYPVVIHKDEYSDFGVIVPDIPGCYSAGSTYDDALNNVIEAIECHLEGLLLDNESLPVGTSLERWIADDSYKGGVWAFVDIDLSQMSGKAKRINITMPNLKFNRFICKKSCCKKSIILSYRCRAKLYRYS